MRIISYILILACLTGCRYTFELDDKNMRSMPAVQSYICADSLVAINIHKTVPLTQIGKADTTLINPHYSLKCNGVEVEVRDSMIGEGGMAICSKAFKNGDELELTFRTDDMETVVAKTSIPEQFPEYSLELTGSHNSETRTLKISYDDNPDTDDWYGAVVRWQGLVYVYFTNSDYTTSFRRNQQTYPPSNYDALKLEPEAYSPLVIFWDNGYLYFWKDSDEEDNEYDLMYSYTHVNDYTSDKVENIKIQCSLYKFSEDMYKRLFAEYDRMSNPLNDIGLASPAFTYSNVSNGLGYFCGYSITESELITDNLSM